MPRRVIIQLVRILETDSDADINVTNCSGATLLHVAAAQGALTVLKLLLSRQDGVSYQTHSRQHSNNSSLLALQAKSRHTLGQYQGERAVGKPLGIASRSDPWPPDGCRDSPRPWR